MVAAFWRHGSLAPLAATLLMAHQAAADPSPQAIAKLSQPTDPQATATLDPEVTGQLNPEVTGQLDPEVTGQLDPEVTGQLDSEVLGQLNPEVTGRLSLDPQATVQLDPQVTGQLSPQAISQLSPQMTGQLSPLVTAQLSPPTNPRVTPHKVGNVLERVPTASWAMGCAAGIALAMHAIYQNSSDRHRTRMQSCADDCPNYRVDPYKETRERADVALRLSVFAAASALWLVYNDPQEALERMGQRKPPREQPGFRVKVKTERRGVWASVVAYF